MNCRQAQRQFSRHRDGMLPASEREGLEAHLKGCNACSGEWALFGRALAGLRREEAPAKVPPHVWVNFKTRLAAEKEDARWWRGESRVLGWCEAGAVCAVVALLVWGWTQTSVEAEQVAMQNFLTDSQVGKVLSVF